MPKPLKYFLLAAKIVILLLIALAVKHYFFTPRWAAYGYSVATGGRNPVDAGERYWDLEACLQGSVKILKTGAKMPDGKPMNAFVCGKDCSMGSGAVFIDELKCVIKRVPVYVR